MIPFAGGIALLALNTRLAQVNIRKGHLEYLPVNAAGAMVAFLLIFFSVLDMNGVI